MIIVIRPLDPTIPSRGYCPVIEETTTEQRQLSGGEAEIEGTPMINQKEQAQQTREPTFFSDACLGAYFLDHPLSPSNKVDSRAPI